MLWKDDHKSCILCHTFPSSFEGMDYLQDKFGIKLETQNLPRDIPRKRRSSPLSLSTSRKNVSEQTSAKAFPVRDESNTATKKRSPEIRIGWRQSELIYCLQNINQGGVCWGTSLSDVKSASVTSVANELNSMPFITSVTIRWFSFFNKSILS